MLGSKLCTCLASASSTPGERHTNLAPWQVLAGTTHQTTSADGFTTYVIYRGPSRVQVHFIGQVGSVPSWLLCEGSPAVSCSFD